MGAIKNIIFDLGGVLLDIDFNKTTDAFKALGAMDFEDFYSKESANDLFEKLETGSIAAVDFYSAMQAHCKPGTSAGQVQAAWNAILIGFRKESIAALAALQTKYSLYLLSNTNIIHHAEFDGLFSRDVGGVFSDCFIKSYYSHEINRRKPYPETYRFVLQDAGMNSTETLFIDDSVNNIEGAKAAGLNTILLKPGERVEGLGL